MSAGWQVVPDQREQVPRQFNFVERSRVKAFMAEVHKRRNRTPWLAVKNTERNIWWHRSRAADTAPGASVFPFDGAVGIC
jgi:hypothetical protein